MHPRTKFVLLKSVFVSFGSCLNENYYNFDIEMKHFDRKLKEYGEEILKSDCDLNDDRDDDLSEDDNEWIENILIKIEKEG